MDSTKANHFDEASKVWDEKPSRVKLAESISKAILRHTSLNSDMRVADYGCGTGLVSTAILDRVKSIVGIDSSTGMLEQFQKKTENLKQVSTILLKPEEDLLPLPSNSIDCFISTMTFHHVPDIAALLTKVRKALTHGGSIVVVDLEEEDGTFHDANMEGIFHKGFSNLFLNTTFHDAGFQNITIDRAAVFQKESTGKDYPIFILIAN